VQLSQATSHFRRLMVFSLLTQPWLPAIEVSGGRLEISLEQALLHPQAFSELDSVRPPEYFALHRLLLAICHRAIGPGDAEQRRGLLNSWPADRIATYLQRWAGRFDLFDAERPFLQIPALAQTDVRLSSWTRASADRSAGNAKTLWSRDFDSSPLPLTSSEAARLLVEHLQFTPMGLVKALRTSGSGAPANNLQLVMPLGRTLQETLALNLIPQPEEEYIVDLPAWEADPPSIESLRSHPETVAQGPAHRYSFLSRAQLLQPSGECIRQMRYAEGLSLQPSPIVDPMVAVVQAAKGPMNQLLNPDRAFWRDAGALLGAHGSTPPAVVRHAADLRLAVGDYSPLELVAGGYVCSKAKPLLWRQERRHVAPALLEQPEAIATIETALHLADETSKALYGPLISMCGDWLTQAQRDADPGASKRLLISTGAQSFYWASLESDFWLLMHRLGQGDASDTSLRAWTTTIRRTVAATWDHARDALGRDGRALYAAGRNSSRLRRVLASVS
jgi:CRISPR system Cascade subunit CasA